MHKLPPMRQEGAQRQKPPQPRPASRQKKRLPPSIPSAFHKKQMPAFRAAAQAARNKKSGANLPRAESAVKAFPIAAPQIRSNFNFPAADAQKNPQTPWRAGRRGRPGQSCFSTWVMQSMVSASGFSNASERVGHPATGQYRQCLGLHGSKCIENSIFSENPEVRAPFRSS